MMYNSTPIIYNNILAYCSILHNVRIQRCIYIYIYIHIHYDIFSTCCRGAPASAEPTTVTTFIIPSDLGNR